MRIVLGLRSISATFGWVVLALALVAEGAAAQDRAQIEITPQVPHSNGITAVAFAPDGARVLSGSFDKTLKLWDAATGQLIRTFNGHSRGVIAVAFSPDGTRVLSGSEDFTLRLWDAVSGGGRTVRLWDAATGRMIYSFENLASAVTSVAFSPDSTLVLSDMEDGRMHLWNGTNEGLLRTFHGTTALPHSVAFSPNGTRLVSGQDTSIKLWDATTGKLIRAFEGHISWMSTVAFSPNGSQLLSGGSDRLSSYGTLRLVN